MCVHFQHYRPIVVTQKNVGEMAAARGLHGDPAQARRDSPDPGRRHDGHLHLAAIFPRRAGRRLLEVLLYTQYSTLAWSYMHRVIYS